MAAFGIRPRSLAPALATVAALSYTACNGDSGQPPADGNEDAPAAETVRPCKSAVWGELSARARRAAVRTGPLELVIVDGGPRAAFEPSTVVKALALVRTGTSVTLAVPSAERDRISLLYDVRSPGPRRPLRLADGTASVRFTACTRTGEWAEGKPYPDRHATQFNGGFFVRGAQCAPLEVRVDGEATPQAISIPFGTGRAPCPP